MKRFYLPAPILPFRYFPGASMIHTLLVDDEPVLLGVSKAFLEREEDISCETCESAQEALELLSIQDFDAVVSDYDMPQMDGIALLKAVRARDPDLPFILLTGRGREEVVIEALNNGADFYLQKSTEPRALYMELASKIRHAVDRRRAKQALIRTQFSIDHLSAELYWIDPNGFLIDVNEYACKKLGYTRDELLAMRVPDVDTDFDIEGFEEAWQEAWKNLKEHQTLNMESRHRKHDGTVYPVELSLNYVKMGEKEFMCAFATDISGRKRAERNLEESREQYCQLVQQSPYGIVIHHEGAVLFCNRIATEILGADDEREVIGRPVLDAVHPDCRDLVVRRIEQLRDNRHLIIPNIEETFIRLDGSAIDVEVTGGQITFDGKPAIQVVFQDITERKQKEKERLALKKQLETEIRDLNLLHALSTRYLKGDDFDTLLQEILESAIAITGADKGNLQLLDPATGMLKIVAQKHFDPPFLEFFAYVDAGDATACGAALEQAERVVVEDICESDVFDEETAAVLLAENVRAVQSTPLVGRSGHLLGILSTHFCRVHAPAEREVRHIDILARQAADMIERKWAEERLGKSEKKYRQLVENANSIILKMDSQGNITLINEFAQRFFGYSFDEILGKNAVGTIVPEMESSGRNLREIILEICAHPERYRIHENENITRDGRRVWIHWTNRVIFDEHGRAAGVLCIGTDVTGQKRAEDRLRESETKYRDLFESSLDGILIADMDGRFTGANSSALEMLGYTREELTRLSYTQITPERWYAADTAAIRQVLAQGHSDLYEKEYIKKDGTAVPINIRIWPMRDNSDTPVGLWGIVRDISKQKEAAQGLNESEQRMNLAIEAAYLGVWDKNLLTGEVATHGYWPGILGYASVEDAPPWEEAVHPDDQGRVLQELRTHMEGATPFMKAEYRIERKDGRYRWIQSRGKVVERDEDEQPIRMIGVDHDITPLHASRESLKEANRKLNLLSSITRHDILNQISAQKAFLALIEEYIPQDTEAHDFYRHLLATSETIRRQIAFTGDYQHMGEREPEWLPVEWVVMRAVESVRLNGTRLEVTTPMPEIFADPMLEKAFANLLDNATAHGNGITAIRVSFRAQNGDGVIILEDDGTGIPAAQKEDIFERGVGKNTGLGLFLTREILGITGISIRECGEEGKGARFEIAIPKGKWRAGEVQ
jgi:PAS domain S-box-containing protein